MNEIISRSSKMNDLTIQLGKIQLAGNLVIPDKAQGLILFAHGSGSSRFSPRNNYVATTLHPYQLATLLFDLLTAEEESIDIYTREFRFDIQLLAERLVGVTEWVQQDNRTKKLNIGYFGSSTGAAAALVAASRCKQSIKAIVSRGGRPDLAGPALKNVEAPTLLIVGGNDLAVIEMNQTAMVQMSAKCDLKIVPGATHLFEEPGTLDQVIEHAGHWFSNYLTIKK